MLTESLEGTPDKLIGNFDSIIVTVSNTNSLTGILQHWRIKNMPSWPSFYYINTDFISLNSMIVNDILRYWKNNFQVKNPMHPTRNRTMYSILGGIFAPYGKAVPEILGLNGH